MTRPYKIALPTAALLCVAILAYYMGQPNPQHASTQTTPGHPPSGATASVGTTPRNTGPNQPNESSPYSPQISRLIAELQHRAPDVDTPPNPTAPATPISRPEPPTLTLGPTNVQALFPITTGKPTEASKPADAKLLNARSASSWNTLSPRDHHNDRAPTQYTVKPGDTFSSIAVTMYGSERYWVDIAQANTRLNPNRLDVGDTIRLPNQNRLHHGHSQSPDQHRPATYTVRPGDSLYTIAGEHYDSPNLWRAIYEANRDRIGRNPASLEAGMALVLPPAP